MHAFTIATFIIDCFTGNSYLHCHVLLKVTVMLMNDFKVYAAMYI